MMMPTFDKTIIIACCLCYLFCPVFGSASPKLNEMPNTGATKGSISAIHIEQPRDINAIVPLNSEAIGVRDTMQRVDLTNAFYAASRAPGQEDKALYSKYFYGRINGTLIESGALNGVKYSVGYAFTKALGWKAVNIEGNGRIFDRLVRSRPDAVNVQAVLCQSPQEMHFIDARRNAKAAGLLEFMPDEVVVEAFGMKRYKKVGSRTGPNNATLSYRFEGLESNKCNVTKVDCVTFKEVASALNIKVVDLWILDVEGGELDVLLGTDFSTFRANVIMVEAGRVKAGRALRLLKEKGYASCQKIATNMACTHNEFVPSVVH